MFLKYFRDYKGCFGDVFEYKLDVFVHTSDVNRMFSSVQGMYWRCFLRIQGMFSRYF